MKILQLICIAALALTLPVKASIRNVPAQYSTIQAAINASVNHDTVLVQPGTYFENINYRGKNIVVTSLYYQNNIYSFIKSTIINGSTPVSPDTASCAIFHNNEDSTAVLQGFTLTGGGGTKWADEHGAGLFREGGGVLVAYCSPVIQNNIITDNHCLEGGGVVSTGGGGLRIGDCYGRVYNNFISNNSARYGAGIVLNYAGGEYRNNVIYKNFGSLEFGAGAGMWLNSNYSRPRNIENNTIVFNTASNGISGIYGFNGVQANIRNNIVWYNTSPSTPQVFGGTLTVRYCNVQGGFTGAGNINIEPNFDTVNYYLKSSSLCIDAGDSSVIYNDPQDPSNPALANWPSKGTVRNDLGAYGGPRSKVIANNVVGVVNNSELLSPGSFHLSQNYPNPFNPSTVISYSLSHTDNVSLKIYNSLGKLAATLVDMNQNAGVYSIEFDGSNLASGIYFYQLSAGEFIETKKMNLIK